MDEIRRLFEFRGVYLGTRKFGPLLEEILATPLTSVVKRPSLKTRLSVEEVLCTEEALCKEEVPLERSPSVEKRPPGFLRLHPLARS